MSKGTIRLPESAIAGGRVGTARIREKIASAAARLESREPMPLDRTLLALSTGLAAQSGVTLGQVIADFASAPDYSPLESMQRLGRGGGGKPNKTEQAYGDLLAARMHNGEILWYRFEAIKLRLADNTFYTPDYPLITAAGALEFHEVKGRWTDDARVKIKVAAAQYPFRFLAIQRAGRHGWRIEDLTSRSW